MRSRSYPALLLSNANRIARTEGHRIQNEAAFDAMHTAKDKGADVVKRWDAMLDGLTRPSHRAVDGEIRDLDKQWDSTLDGRTRDSHRDSMEKFENSTSSSVAYSGSFSMISLIEFSELYVK